MDLTYKLESFIEKISSPVLLEYNGETLKFPNGAAAREHFFDKYLLVSDIQAHGNKIHMILKENDRWNDTNWCGEEQVVFI